MKTKVKSFKELTKEFDYVNENIESKFPLEDRKLTDYKLYNFERYISSEDAVKEMEKDGYSPANLYELLSWGDWSKEDTVVALGSVGKVHGDRFVPCLDRNGSKRNLYLYWWGNVWYSYYRFLAVRNLSLNNSDTSKSALGNLENLTLESAIKICRENGLEVYKK